MTWKTTWLSAGLLAGAALAVSRRKRFSFGGKNALVIGGSRGLGLDIARILVGRGASVAVVARDEAEIARALEDLGRRAPADTKVIGQTCNLEDATSVENMLAEVDRRLGPVDVLINDAGIIQIGPLESMGIEDFERSVRVHALGPLRVILGLRQTMKARGGGRIANISSIGGVLSVPHLLPYCTGKFALMGLSLGLRAELAKDGIVVTTVAPGLMRTGSPRHATVKGAHEKEYGWFATSDALPLVSVDAPRAAARIVRAIERGEAHVVIGAPAKLAAFVQGLLPGWTADVLALVNRLLPKGTNPEPREGSTTEAKWVPSPLRTVNDAAAATHNE